MKKQNVDMSEAYQKILHWFFSFPKAEMNLNTISSKLKISKTTTNKVVRWLVSEGFLFKKVYGKTWVITCNIHHRYNFSKKVLYNIDGVYMLLEQGLREKIYHMVRNPKCVVLFGSYRRGDNDERSDIDLAVEVVGDDEFRIVHLTKVDTNYLKGIDVNLHIFSRKKLDINLFANIANGFVLEGFLEVRP